MLCFVVPLRWFEEDLTISTLWRSDDSARGPNTSDCPAEEGGGAALRSTSLWATSACWRRLGSFRVGCSGTTWRTWVTSAPFVQILDLPVPQMVDTVLEFFRRLDLPVAEQVIEVPKVSPSSCPSRAVLREPQMLVEVPTVLSFALLQQRNVEQIIDIPVPRHGGSRSLQGVHPGPGSLQRFVEQIPVPHGRGSRGGLQGFSPGQSSTQRIMEQNVDLPVPGPRPSRGFPPGQGLQRKVEQIIDFPVSRTRDGGGLPGFHLEQSSTARGGAHS